MSLPSSLPRPVATFLQAINRNSKKFYTTFSSTSTLIDEGRTFKGHGEIEKFRNEALVSHSASIIFESVIQVGEHIIVQVTMDGEFVEDYGITEPFTLYFNFVLENSTVEYLLITPWNSSKPTMNAVYVDKANIDDPISAIKITPRPLPIPEEGWLKVKVQAAGLNYHDVYTIRGLALKTGQKSFSTPQ